VAEAFIASRLAGRRGQTFGSLAVDLAGSTGEVIGRYL
jgi:putative acyl-CoA dehydrogenase